MDNKNNKKIITKQIIIKNNINTQNKNTNKFYVATGTTNITLIDKGINNNKNK